MIKSTDNSQVVALLNNTIVSGQNWTGDNRFYGTTWLNMTGVVNNKTVGGRIDQTIGDYNCQYGSMKTFQNQITGWGLNTGMGKVMMEALTTGYANTCIGNGVLQYTTTGYYNTCLGQYCGQGIITGYKNTLVGAQTNVASDSYNNSTCIGYGSNITASNQITLGTVTETVLIPNSITTQGLVYEVINTATGTTTAFTLNYATGGNFVLSSITGTATLGVTNLPISTSSAYTFSVSYFQASTRNYISTVQFQDTGSAYITNSGSAGFVAPLWNGGTISLSGTSNCVIIQTFTILSVGGSRRVTSSLSCCS